MSKKKIRSAYSGSIDVSVPVVNKGHTRVKQEFAREVNINSIIAKMKRGVAPSSFATGTPIYGDFTQGPQNFMDAFDVVQRAERAFASLPLGFRRALDHDPKNLPFATRELYEEFGMLKEAPASGSAATTGASTREGQGDRNLPATGRPGPDKRASIKKPDAPSDEE